MRDDEEKAARNSNVLKAIAVMTAWTESHSEDPGASLVPMIVMDDFEEDGGASVMTGLISLCGHLLVRVEKATGAPPEVTLQDLATRYV